MCLLICDYWEGFLYMHTETGFFIMNYLPLNSFLFTLRQAQGERILGYTLFLPVRPEFIEGRILPVITISSFPTRLSYGINSGGNPHHIVIPSLPLFKFINLLSGNPYQIDLSVRNVYGFPSPGEWRESFRLMIWQFQGNDMNISGSQVINPSLFSPVSGTGQTL